MAEFEPIECKCCGGEAVFRGTVDFNRSCVDRFGERAFPVSDVLIPYWICTRCGFIFTNHMDTWSAEDFRQKIYNDDYVLADPPVFGMSNVPPRETPGYEHGKLIAALLNGSQDKITILDFGSGGNPGPTGLALRDNHFNVVSYDAYRADISDPPDRVFDVIVAIEVFEHCHDLEDLKNFMERYLSPNGIIWISTVLHVFPAPPDILESWYIAPRNGHISIFSFIALAALFRSVGINIVQTMHGVIGFKDMPNFENQILVKPIAAKARGKFLGIFGK